MADWTDKLKQFGYEISEKEGAEREEKQADYQNPSYNIVAIVGYLIGVPKVRFESDDNPAMNMNTYQRLDKDPKYRIIRNLCMIRTSMELYYAHLFQAFIYEFKNIDTVPEYIPTEAVKQLREDGISLRKNKPVIDEYIIEINKNISSRISNCSKLFPDWINWEYIKDLFIMPNGNKIEGVKEEGNFYKSDINRYPYQCYINWPVSNAGNILYCDEKFVTQVYEFHEDGFDDMSLVRNASDTMTGELDKFLGSGKKTIIAVDCENANPIKAAAMLMSLTEEQKNRIYKVLLFDSHYSIAGWSEVAKADSAPKGGDPLTDWNIMGKVPGLEYEHIVQERMLEAKSQVDMQLVVRVTTEVFTEGVDSVILVASDSDYSSLMDSLMFGNGNRAKFMCMVENGKMSKAFKEFLQKKWIPCIYIDDYCTSLSYSIKTEAIKGIIQHKLDKLSFNSKEMLESAIDASYLEISEKEKNIFMDKYIKRAHVEIDKEGNFRIVLGEK